MKKNKYEVEEVISLKCIPWCFETLSRRRINFSKLKLAGINVSEGNLKLVADEFGSKEGKLPITYLGLPLVVERVEKHLATWRSKSLSIGGHITLIKSDFANLPIYFLSVFRCPASVIQRIEKLQRDS